MTWTFTEFKPKEATPEEWAKFHVYWKIRQKETRPDDPIPPDEEVETQMKMDNPFTEVWRFVIYDDDQQISSFSANVDKPESPGYESSKHLFNASASVLKEFRRRGIGRLWLPKVLELMEKTNTSVLTSGTEQEEGHEFLKWVGFEGKSAQAENRLNFKEIDWDMINQWIEEGPKASPETKLEFWENRIPESEWEEYCKAITPVLNTMPFDDLDHGEIIMTPEILTEMYKHFDVMKGDHHTLITREPDGSISGMTDVAWVSSAPNFVYQQFTGVRPDARGRGLGKWLKAYMVNFLKTRYEGIDWISTGNANSNDPMLGINKKMGFKEFKASVAYQIPKEKLAARVGELGL